MTNTNYDESVNILRECAMETCYKCSHVNLEDCPAYKLLEYADKIEFFMDDTEKNLCPNYKDQQ